MNRSLVKNHEYVESKRNKKIDMTYDSYYNAIKKFNDPLQMVIEKQHEEIQRLKGEVLYWKSKAS